MSDDSEKLKLIRTSLRLATNHAEDSEWWDGYAAAAAQVFAILNE